MADEGIQSPAVCVRADADEDFFEDSLPKGEAENIADDMVEERKTDVIVTDSLTQHNYTDSSRNVKIVTDHDSIEMYLLSLAPTLRKLPFRELNRVKLEIQKIIVAAEYSD